MNRLTVIAWLAGDTGKYTGDLRAAIGRDLDELCAGAKDARNIAVWAAYDDGVIVVWRDCSSPASCGGLIDNNMADPRALMMFADYVMYQSPAEQYALIIGSHGSGPKQQDVYPTRGLLRGEYYVDMSRERFDAVDTSRGVIDKTSTTVSKTATVDLAFDDGSRQALSVAQLGEVCQHIASRGPLAVVLLDACHMASVEVCEALLGTCSVLVASPEAMPAMGFPYDDLIREWDASVDWRAGMALDDLAAGLGEMAVSVFADYYEQPGHASIVAVDMAKVPGMLADLDLVAEAPVIKVDVSSGDTDMRYLAGTLGQNCILDEWHQNTSGAGLTAYVPERGPLPAWYSALPIASRPWGLWVKRMVEGT